MDDSKKDSKFQLTKDLIQLAFKGAQKGKDELLDRIGTEIVTMVQKIDFVREASRFAETHRFKITAEIEVIKKDSSPNPSQPSSGTSASSAAARKPRS